MVRFAPGGLLWSPGALLFFGEAGSAFADEVALEVEFAFAVLEDEQQGRVGLTGDPGHVAREALVQQERTVGLKLAEAEGIRDQVKIMVGGAPLTAAFAQKIGADAYTADATSAAEVAAEYCS